MTNSLSISGQGHVRIAGTLGNAGDGKAAWMKLHTTRGNGQKPVHVLACFWENLEETYMDTMRRCESPYRMEPELRIESETWRLLLFSY